MEIRYHVVLSSLYRILDETENQTVKLNLKETIHPILTPHGWLWEVEIESFIFISVIRTWIGPVIIGTNWIVH